MPISLFRSFSSIWPVPEGQGWRVMGVGKRLCLWATRIGVRKCSGT